MEEDQEQAPRFEYEIEKNIDIYSKNFQSKKFMNRTIFRYFARNQPKNKGGSSFQSRLSNLNSLSADISKTSVPNFKDGIITGKGIVMDNDDNLLYEGLFRNNLPNGMGTYYLNHLLTLKQF